MRARLYTAAGELGTVDIVDGASVVDVVRAMRERRLFITALPDGAPTTLLPAASGTDVTLPAPPPEAPAPMRRRRRSS